MKAVKIALPLFLGVGLFLLPLRARAAAWSVETLLDSGASENRITIAILADGYAAGSDQAQLSEDAKKLVSGLFALPPYKEYKGLFNVKLVHVESADSGVTNDPLGTKRNTAFGSRFFCNPTVARSMCGNDGAVLATAAENVPEYGVALLLSNSNVYGGSANTQVVTMSRNASAPDVVTHELGHLLGSLADEYSDPNPGTLPCGLLFGINDCPEANVTIRRTRDQLKWRHWLADETPIPTNVGYSTNHLAVGAYEGARYTQGGVFRPREDCQMRHLHVAFCPVCAERMNIAFWERTSTIDGLEKTGPSTWTVRTPAVSTPFELHWTVDGIDQAATGTSITVDPALFGDGVHEVRVVVRDATDRIVYDAKNAREDVATTYFSCGGDGDGEFLGSGGAACQPEAPPRKAHCSMSVPTREQSWVSSTIGAAFAGLLAWALRRKRRATR